MIAPGKLFRTTAFKISLAYLVISALGSGIVLMSVGDNIKDVIHEQISHTIDADITGLSEQYTQGGITTLVEIIERRTSVPGTGLYLVTTPAGEPIAGNVQSLPPGVLETTGVVETTYRVRGNRVAPVRNALARIFALPGGFRLLVGHDLAEGENLRPILANALVNSLIWFTIIGTVGGLFLARRVLHRVDAINARAATIVAGDLLGRLPLAGTGDELDRLVENLNAMLDRIAILMAGLKEVSDNVAHDLKTPLTRLRSRAEEALRPGAKPEDYREALEKVIEESDGLIRVFDALLMIARAPRPGPGARAWPISMPRWPQATSANSTNPSPRPMASSSKARSSSGSGFTAAANSWASPPPISSTMPSNTGFSLIPGKLKTGHRGRSRFRPGAAAGRSRSRSPIAVPASPRTIAAGLPSASCGSKIRARNRDPASACRSSRRSRGSITERCGSRTTAQVCGSCSFCRQSVFRLRPCSRPAKPRRAWVEAVSVASLAKTVFAGTFFQRRPYGDLGARAALCVLFSFPLSLGAVLTAKVATS